VYDPAVPRRLDALRSVLAAPVGAVAAGASIALAAGLRASGWVDGLPAGLVVAAPLLLLAPLALVAARRTKLGGAPAVALLAASASAIMVGYHARAQTEHALCWRSYYGVDYLEPEVAVPWAALLALLVGLAATAVMRSSPPARAARLLRASAAFAVALAGALVAFGHVRRDRPDAEAFVASLPSLGTLPAIEGIPADYTIAKLANEDRDFDGVFTRRRCVPGRGCSIQIVIRPEERTDEIPARREWFLADVLRGGVLRRDARHGLVVLETPNDRWWVDAATGEYASPAIDRSSIGPPRRWVLGGAAGVLVATLALLWRPAPVRAARRAARAKEGVHDGRRVTFDDGTPPVDLSGVAIPRPIAPGPVLVVAAGAPADPSFRESGAIRPVAVLAGTRADLEAAADRATAEHAAYAILAVAITCAPLAIS